MYDYQDDHDDDVPMVVNIVHDLVAGILPQAISPLAFSSMVIIIIIIIIIVIVIMVRIQHCVNRIGQSSL